MWFRILNNLVAPSGIFWTPDSHLAKVRGETSTCRAAFASDKPRVLRNCFSSEPTIPLRTAPVHFAPHTTKADLTTHRITRPGQTAPRLVYCLIT